MGKILPLLFSNENKGKVLELKPFTAPPSGCSKYNVQIVLYIETV